MKRCPECRRDYYDDTLLYCLNDGTALLEGQASMDEPATELFGETPRAILSETRRETGVETSDRLLDKRLLLVPVVLAIILGGFFGYRCFFTFRRRADRLDPGDALRGTYTLRQVCVMRP